MRKVKLRNISTITKVVNFTPVKAEDFYPDFFTESGKVKAESAIESVYSNNILLSTTGKVDVIKEEMCKRGTCDGIVRFKFDSNIIEFLGIQECKKELKRTSIKYPRQILQALLYAVQLPDCKVLIINSENYFDYIIIDENKEYILNKREELLAILKEARPSDGYKICDFVEDLRNLKIHTNDIPEKSELDKIMLDIYRRCY